VGDDMSEEEEEEEEEAKMECRVSVFILVSVCIDASLISYGRQGSMHEDDLGCQEKSTKYRFKLFVPSILAFHSGSLNYEQSIHLIFIHIQQPTPNTHPLIHSHGPFAALLFLRSANKAEPPTAAVLNPPCRKSKNKRERKRSHVINAYVLLHRL
jgi:hypothetical protein